MELISLNIFRQFTQKSRSTGAAGESESSSPSKQELYTPHFQVYLELKVFQVKIRTSDIPSVSVNSRLEEIRTALRRSDYGAIPVWEDKNNRRQYTGVINIDSLLDIPKSKERSVKATDLRGKLMMLPESQSIHSALIQFTKTRQSIAVVVNEYGDYTGFVTRDDILDELADNHVSDIVQKDNGQLEVNALIRTEILNRDLGTNIPEDRFRTLSGWLLHHREEFEDFGSNLSGIRNSGFIFLPAFDREDRIKKVIVRSVESAGTPASEKKL